MSQTDTRERQVRQVGADGIATARSSAGPAPRSTSPLADPAADNLPVAPTGTQIPYEDEDGDSAIDDDGSVLSSTASLSESIFDYRSIHGRTFQNSRTTEYWGPNDDRQNNGLDIAHHFMMMLKGDRLFDAPIDRPKRILDVGTGTGIWAMVMADAYPSAQITGTDISPIQPTWVPPNCISQIEDAQLEWTYRPESFDFVHMRALYGSISDWAELYRQAYRALAPGGWVEDFEINIHLHSDIPEVRDDPEHIFKRWAKIFWEGGDRIDRTLRIANTAPCASSSSGPASPADPKMKQIGAYNLAFMDESLEGFALFILKESMGWKYEEVQLFVMEMRKAIRNPRIRPTYLM
ncbi:hypothetical protein Purlil1_12885 [Purpureocillium lilacinum]|uniref:Uncharacterized protein n=1 Tax=Purpureocillium lilacinum TaxID=33203 RepID=A0ABR0BFL7_PURLI|nr:hypothetical protein Purlil1_12885 [Purpureocillium lilacinum]